MKKIYVLIAALSVTVASQAQITEVRTAKLIATKSAPVSTLPSAAKTAVAMPGDTTGWSNYADFSPEFNPNGSNVSIYGDADGGYIYGRNTLLSTSAQAYYNLGLTPISIEKVILWGAEKQQAQPPLATSNVSVSIWTMAANKARSYVAPVPPATTGTFPLDQYGPNVKLNPTAVININAIDTSFVTPAGDVAFTTVTFPTPIQLSTDFAIVVNSFGLAAGDTVGFVSDATASAAGINLTFHATAANAWYVTNYVYGGIDNNAAYFAVLGALTAVNEYVNGVKLSALYPNPTKDVATISYSLEKASNNVSLEVFSVTGHKVYSQAFGTQQAGDYKINLDASSYAAGSYFYQLRSNGSVLTKEFIVTK